MCYVQGNACPKNGANVDISRHDISISLFTLADGRPATTTSEAGQTLQNGTMQGTPCNLRMHLH